MKLSEYPRAIAEVEKELLRLVRDLRRVQEAINGAVNQAERAIAFDAELKNDAQRKAKRLELLALDKRYGSAMSMAVRMGDRKAELEIDLAFYRAQFSVLKLQVRDRISQAEVRVAA